ncbi:hypothetical protein EDD29_1670 [Actinocorallia herbida]|uniref:Uncharacterized protein n=2 Tax=Actinocorallia herbida TaxID=58109 RepID=A0A3N1CS75_9ACTN|nr:hypothetical protein EDD29_1670 [Actinocorallia herbida]
MTAAEAERFIVTMVPVVAQHLAESGRFRISAWTEELQAVFREITGRTSAALGRPLMGYTNGREFWIVPSDAADEVDVNAAAPLTP